MTDIITEPGMYEMSNADYHAQPALSASGMKTLLEAPAKFRYQRENHVYKPAFDFGSLWHKYVLNDEHEQFVVVQKRNRHKELVDAYDYDTVSAREHQAEIRAEGKIPILAKELRVIKDMAGVFRMNPDVQRLIDLDKGKIEQSAFWQDARTGVWLRARFDYLPDAVPGQPFIIGDPKTAISSHPERWMRKVSDYGYDIQDAMYREAARVMGFDPRPRFQFAVQEKTAPYIVTVIELDAEARAIGEYKMREAIDLYLECTQNNHWPGYVEGVAIGHLPAYETQPYEGLIAS